MSSFRNHKDDAHKALNGCLADMMSLSPDYNDAEYRIVMEEIRSEIPRVGKAFANQFMATLVESNFVMFLTQSLCPPKNCGNGVQISSWQHMHITTIFRACSMSANAGAVISTSDLLPTLLTAFHAQRFGTTGLFALPLLSLFCCARSAVPVQSRAERIGTVDALMASMRNNITFDALPNSHKVETFEAWCEAMLMACGSGSGDVLNQGGVRDGNDLPLPMTTVAAIVDVVADILMRYYGPNDAFHLSRELFFAAVPLLSALFQCDDRENSDNGSGQNTSDREAHNALLAAFALSPVFDRVFTLIYHASGATLHSMFAILNRSACLDSCVVERVFTQSRLNDLAKREFLNSTTASNAAYICFITRLLQGPSTVAHCVFAAALPPPRNVRCVLVNRAMSNLTASAWLIDDEYYIAVSNATLGARECLPMYMKLIEALADAWPSMLLPFDNADDAVSWMPDLSRCELFIASGLLSAVLDSSNSSSTHINISSVTTMTARLLRVLRKLISGEETDAVREQRARGENVPTNRFVEFYSSNKLRCKVFDLLLMADCTLVDGDNNPVLHELLLMHADPECSKLFSDSERKHRLALIEAGNFDWRRGVEDVARFAQGFKGGWKEAFNAYIAVELEGYGFPRSLPTVASVSTPAPASAYGKLSLSALSLLQRRAQLLLNEKTLLANQASTKELMVVFGARSAYQVRQNTFRLVVSTEGAYGDDDELNCHIAFFNLASTVSAWQGVKQHTCCLPPGLRAEDAPFVALFFGDLNAPCFPRPITLPETDTVFGQYTIPSDIDTLTYPAGTVLLRPRTISPSSTLLLVFVVFKSCPATLLRGAVPVGRVVCCGHNDALLSKFDEQTDGGPPFTEERLRWFESRCATRPCSEKN